MIETISAQLVDPFRIGLIIFLVLTAQRTSPTMGLIVPLALGVVFIAVMLPMTLGTGTTEATGGLVPSVVAGLVANVILLGIVLLGWALWQRLRR